ncbi:MAG: cell division protein FtsQ [Candidatus Omnitrophica bacterium]|nr:cell division protein FtsQ [Candidatus Omnitrophota bacterium]
MRKRKIALPDKRVSSRVSRLKVVFILAFILSLAAIGLIGRYWRLAFRGFRVKEVMVKDGASINLDHLKGHAIFDIDLGKEAELLLWRYPQYKAVRLIRVLPDRIFADFIKRLPYALIESERIFAIDQEQVLFDTDISGLPVIVGPRAKIAGLRPGKRYNIKELGLALEIISELKADAYASGLKLKSVDVSSLDNAFLIFSEGQEVRLGQYNIREKIGILSGLFAQFKDSLADIEYIDLRFKEPVMKFKKGKS